MRIEQEHIVPITSDSGRTYEVTTPTGLIRVPSVTTIINFVLNKPALVEWSYSVGVRETFAYLDGLLRKGLVDDFENEYYAVNAEDWPEADGFVKLWLKENEKTHRDEMGKGADRGIVVHDALEHIINGTIEDWTYRKEYRPYMETLKQFISDYDPEWLKTEQKVASVDDEFAGQFDAIGIPRKQPPRRRHKEVVGKTVLFDIKTNKDGKVYAESHLPQVEAYEKAYNECDGEFQIDECMVIGIGPSSYQPCVSYADYNVFKAILDTYNALLGMKDNNPNKRK